MRFKIPRYIDYEAKIFGPANFKQFVFIVIGILILAILWKLIDNFLIFALFALVVSGIIGMIAFGKINGQPFLTMVGKYFIFRVSGKKTYLWKKVEMPDRLIQAEKIKLEKKEKKLFNISRRKGQLDNISKKIETS